MIFPSSVTAIPAALLSFDRGRGLSSGHQRHLGDAKDSRRSKRDRLSWRCGCGSVVSERSDLGSLGELRKGVEAKRRTDLAAADRLGAWVDDIETIFADRVLPVDSAIARRWGELSAARSLPVIDTLIAATAIGHDLTLVTRNTRDVELTGVRFVDPWVLPELE